MKPLPQIMVAPNGARHQKEQHPKLPITINETVACAVECFAAGAEAIHAHIRDADGRHLLDAKTYQTLIAELRSAVPDMGIQITTEAAGLYDPEQQMDVALNTDAHSISVSIREICRAEPNKVRQFLDICVAHEKRLQFILYDLSDCDLLNRTLAANELQNPELQILFVLGSYAGKNAKPSDLDPFLNWAKLLNIKPDWAVCAFGKFEAQCLITAVQNGGKCRTGFENSFHLSDGTLASDNSQKVSDLKQLINVNSV